MRSVAEMEAFFEGQRSMIETLRVALQAWDLGECCKSNLESITDAATRGIEHAIRLVAAEREKRNDPSNS